MHVERSRDIAHVGAVELRTPRRDQTVDFFVRLRWRERAAGRLAA